MENRPNGRETCNITSSCIDKCCIPMSQQNAGTQETRMLCGPWIVVTSTLCHVTVMIIIEHLAVACSAGAALVNECPDSLGSTHLRVETHYDEEDPANYVTKEEYLRMQTLGSTRGG